MNSHRKSQKTVMIGVALLFAIIIFGTLLTMIPQVSAQQIINNDFEVNLYSVSYDFYTGAINSQPTICSCSGTTDRIYLENTGSFGAEFTITTNLNEYVTIPVNKLHLEPQQSVNLDLFINTQCGTEFIKDYDINIKSNIGREQTITRDLSVIKCQTINANLYSEKEIMEPCQTNEYEIEIINPSTFTEQYLIMPISENSGFHSQNTNTEELMNSQILTLKPEQKGIAKFTYEPQCSEFGNKTITFQIHSQNNNLDALLSHELEIKRAYQFSQNTQENVSVCINEKKYVPLTIKNEGKVTNTYNLQLLGNPSFVKLQETQITLEPGKNKIINLEINPNQQNKGIYTFNIKTSTELGNLESKQQITLNTYDCYDFNVEILGYKPTKFCTGENTLDVKIINNGQTDEEIELYYWDAKETSQIKDTKLKILAGQEKSTQIKFKTNNSEEEHSIYVSAKIPRVNQIWKDEQKIITLTQAECTQITYLYTNLKPRYEHTEASIKIKNTGTKTSEYTITYEGTENIKLQENKINLEKDEEKYVHLDIKHNTNETQYFTITLKNKENNEEYKQQFTLRFENEPFYETWYKYFSQDTCKSATGILLIILIAAIILLIVRISIKGTKNNLIKALILLIILIILIIITVTTALPEKELPGIPQEKADDPLYFIWYEDTSYTVDLSNYFSDPDMDQLTYEYDYKPEEIDVKFYGSKAILTPKTNYYGEDSIKFIVTDIAGETVKSPRIRTEVLDTKEIIFTEFYEENCKFINLLLIMLIVILMILTPFSKKKKETIINRNNITKSNTKKSTKNKIVKKTNSKRK
ncbi:hypothetical protein K9L67_00390 [Candidatus Woesearchaeota archaeon]|nr:hypothetical protein [Candidatus Woesearchaeota archaeon]MCF7900664.1 hypothetical protein [Candidatus Woesearchaeota archaeon]MCF8013501.1 hypothetical protein [Candidatus Woesearchaeota archaeon]